MSIRAVAASGLGIIMYAKELMGEPRTACSLNSGQYCIVPSMRTA